MTARAIVIVGSPGTGKTTVAAGIAERGFRTINLGEFSKNSGCIEGYDAERDSYIVNTECLHKKLDEFLTETAGIIVLEGHYGDIVPKKYVDKCFVLSAPIGILKTRLEERGYPPQKVDENTQAEIMQVCWTDAIEVFGPSRVTKIENMVLSDIVALIASYLEEEVNSEVN